jgi:hypothetical protein
MKATVVLQSISTQPTGRIPYVKIADRTLARIRKDIEEYILIDA